MRKLALLLLAFAVPLTACAPQPQYIVVEEDDDDDRYEDRYERDDD